MKIKVRLMHAHDGIKDFYRPQWQKYENRFEQELQRFADDGIILNKGDMISIQEDENDIKHGGDAVFYIIKRKWFEYFKNEIILTYSVKD